MASGIVATALFSTGMTVAADVLFGLTVVAFVVLAVVAAARYHTPGALRAEVAAAGFTALAIPAGASVVAGYAANRGLIGFAMVFAAIGMLTWAVLGYLVPAQRVIDNTDNTAPGELNRADGTWFLWGVATQSVAVASGAIAADRPETVFVTIAELWWGLGMAQLVLVAAVVAARMMLATLRRTDEVAPYWVFFGSASISILAGAELVGLADRDTILSTALVTSMCLCLWAFASWLAPLLVALTIWQWRRSPDGAGFRLALWSMVFPVGMYGHATLRLGEVADISWLAGFGRAEAWLAAAVWCAVAVGMVVSVTRRKPSGAAGT